MSGQPALIAYLQNQWIDAAQAALPVWDRGVVQAATVTEMVRTFARQPFRLNQHLMRLRSSLDYLGLEISESNSELTEIVTRLIEHNSRTLPPQADLGVVLLVTAGALPMYAGGLPSSLAPTVCVHTFPLPFSMWAAKYTCGQPLVVPSIRQVPFDVISPQIKHRSRLHWYRADREAQAVDPEAVALLMSSGGSVTETNSGNFLIVKDGRIVTPPPEETLPGISQSFIGELATALSIPYEARHLTLNEALGADEAMVSSTTYCILPVNRINCQPIGTGAPGPLTQKLLTAWSDWIGFDIVAQATKDFSLP